MTMKPQINEFVLRLLELKGGEGSGNFAPHHHGRPGFVGGSSTTSSTPKKRKTAKPSTALTRSGGAGRGRIANRRHIKPRKLPNPEITKKESRDLLQKAVSTGGFTYEPIANVSPTSGYALSNFKDKELIVSVDDLSSSTIFRYMQKHSEVLKDPNVYVGGWWDTRTDEVYLDISTILDDRGAAIEMAREMDEEGIFDLSNFETIIVKAKKGSIKGTYVSGNSKRDAEALYKKLVANRKNKKK